MLGELNAIASEEEATKWAHRRLPEKNKLNAADAKHVEEAFRTKLLSFAIHHAEGVAELNNTAQTPNTADGRNRKGRVPPASPSVDKSVLMHPEPRRIRDRNHVRFVAQQTCLVCGRQPCDAHHLRFAQTADDGRRKADVHRPGRFAAPQSAHARGRESAAARDASGRTSRPMTPAASLSCRVHLSRREFVHRFSAPALPPIGGWQSSTAWLETPPQCAWRLLR